MPFPRPAFFERAVELLEARSVKGVERSLKSSIFGEPVTEDLDRADGPSLSKPKIENDEGDLAILLGLYGVGYTVFPSFEYFADVVLRQVAGEAFVGWCHAQNA